MQGQSPPRPAAWQTRHTATHIPQKERDDRVSDGMRTGKSLQTCQQLRKFGSRSFLALGIPFVFTCYNLWQGKVDAVCVYHPTNDSYDLNAGNIRSVKPLGKLHRTIFPDPVAL